MGVTEVWSVLKREKDNAEIKEKDEEFTRICTISTFVYLSPRIGFHGPEDH